MHEGRTSQNETHVQKIQPYITSKNYRQQVPMAKIQKVKERGKGKGKGKGEGKCEDSGTERQSQKRKQMRKKKKKTKAKAKAKQKQQQQHREPRKKAPTRKAQFSKNLQFPESGLGTRHCRNFTQAS